MAHATILMTQLTIPKIVPSFSRKPFSNPCYLLITGLFYVSVITVILMLSCCATGSGTTKGGAAKTRNPHLYEGAPKPESEVAIFVTTGTSLSSVDGRMASAWPEQIYLLPGKHEFSFPDRVRPEVIELKAGHHYERPSVHFLVDAHGDPLHARGIDSNPSAATRATLLQAGGALGFGSTYTYHMFVDRTTRRVVSVCSPQFRRLVDADRAAAASELGVPTSTLP
jgi:hypothetical protein